MSTKSTIKYEPATGNKRIEQSITREINASPDKIFPLACPVEELRWIPEWDYRLVYSKSGVNETNCIFTEEKSGPHFFGKPMTTTWVTNIHDSRQKRILFQIMLAEKAIIRFRFDFREVGPDTSSCTWQMVFTAMDEEANQMDDEDIRTKLELLMTFLAEALKYYCENGKMIG